MTAQEPPVTSSGPSTPVSTKRDVRDGCNRPSVSYAGTPWGDVRQTIGCSLRELEELTGINRGELSKIERGRSCPSPDQARKILAALDAPR